MFVRACGVDEDDAADWVAAWRRLHTGAASRSDAAPVAPVAGLRPGPARSVPAQLPVDVLGFSGRAFELARLDAMLADAAEKPAAVVISALLSTAGVGKTALAVHWAHRVRHRFGDGGPWTAAWVIVATRGRIGSHPAGTRADAGRPGAIWGMTGVRSADRSAGGCPGAAGDEDPASMIETGRPPQPWPAISVSMGVASPGARRAVVDHTDVLRPSRPRYRPAAVVQRRRTRSPSRSPTALTGQGQPIETW